MRRPSPNGWRRVTLGEVVASISAGVSVNGTNERVSSAQDIGVLKTSCVTTGVFRPAENKAVIDQDLHRVSTPVRAGVIVVSRMNTRDLVGASAYVPTSHANLFLPDRLWQIKVSTAVDAHWLAYVLASEVMRNQLRDVASGTSGSMKNLSQRAFCGLAVGLPPLDTQRRIVAALDIAYDSASLGKKLIAAQQARYQVCLLKELVPIQSKSMVGWRTLRFDELFKQRDECGVDLPLLAITGEHGVVPRDELERRDTSAADKSKYKVIRKGDIGYNTMRMWQGVCGLSQYDGLVSPAYTVVTPDESRVLGRFAAHLLRHPRVIRTFHRYSQGLVDDTLMLKYPHFSEISLAIPGLAEQRRIADLLDAQLELVEQQRRMVELREQQKRGLMQKLLTGEWRLPHDLPDTEAADVGA